LKIEDCKLKIECWVDFRFFRIFLLIFLFLITSKADAQNSATHFHAEYSIAAGSPELPFWLYANSDARLRTNSSFNSLLNVGFTDRLTSESQRIQLQAGADLFSRLSDTQNTLHFQQLYLQADFWILQLKAGNFYDPIGLNESDLSIGSMMVSRNATPMPRIRLSTPDYISVPGTNDFLQFKARYSEGILESDRIIPDANLHQKYLYLRLHPHDRVYLYGGIVHNLVWGGSDETGRRFFSTFGNYLRSVMGIPREGGPTPAGNTVAAYDFAAEYNSDAYHIKASRLFYLEDMISARFRSPWDGVWGLQVSKQEQVGYLHSIHYQHINTKRQDSRGGQPPGRARYYWNVHYQTGWTYQGSVLGIPLIQFDENKVLGNNMVVGHHLGLSGKVQENLTYKAFFTYTRNYGNCLDVQPDFERFNQCLIPSDQDLDEITIVPLNQLRRDQHSIMFQFFYRLPALANLQVHLKLATDTGRLYDERIGVMAGFRWDGIF
jgi:hypothetical protein